MLLWFELFPANAAAILLLQLMFLPWSLQDYTYIHVHADKIIFMPYSEVPMTILTIATANHAYAGVTVSI